MINDQYRCIEYKKRKRIILEFSAMTTTVTTVKSILDGTHGHRDP